MQRPSSSHGPILPPAEETFYLVQTSRQQYPSHPSEGLRLLQAAWHISDVLLQRHRPGNRLYLLQESVKGVIRRFLYAIPHPLPTPFP